MTDLFYFFVLFFLLGILSSLVISFLMAMIRQQFIVNAIDASVLFFLLVAFCCVLYLICTFQTQKKKPQLNTPSFVPSLAARAINDPNCDSACEQLYALIGNDVCNTTYCQSVYPDICGYCTLETIGSCATGEQAKQEINAQCTGTLTSEQEAICTSACTVYNEEFTDPNVCTIGYCQSNVFQNQCDYCGVDSIATCPTGNAALQEIDRVCLGLETDPAECAMACSTYVLEFPNDIDVCASSYCANIGYTDVCVCSVSRVGLCTVNDQVALFDDINETCTVGGTADPNCAVGCSTLFEYQLETQDNLHGVCANLYCSEIEPFREPCRLVQCDFDHLDNCSVAQLKRLIDASCGNDIGLVTLGTFTSSPGIVTLSQAPPTSFRLTSTNGTFYQNNVALPQFWTKGLISNLAVFLQSPIDVTSNTVVVKGPVQTPVRGTFSSVANVQMYVEANEKRVYLFLPSINSLAGQLPSLLYFYNLQFTSEPSYNLNGACIVLWWDEYYMILVFYVPTLNTSTVISQLGTLTLQTQETIRPLNATLANNLFGQVSQKQFQQRSVGKAATKTTTL